MSALKKVLDHMGELNRSAELWPRHAKIGVAVSGGPDSTALLRALLLLQKKWNLTLHVLHMDHRLQSVTRDHARFVVDLCQRHGIPVHLGRWTGKWNEAGQEAKPGGQEASRTVRLRFFEKKAGELGLTTLALGHNADDQAETILWRLLRGGAPEALQGIHAKRLWHGLTLIRPLLSTSRSEITAMLQELGQEVCEDPSNQKTGYLRNRIRHELLPLLEERYNPRIKEHLCHLGEAGRRENRLVERQLEGWLKENLPQGVKASGKGRHFKMPRDLLRHCPPELRLRVLHRIARDLLAPGFKDLKNRHLLALEHLSLAPGPGTLALPGGWAASATSLAKGDHLIIEPLLHASPLPRACKSAPERPGTRR